MRRQFFWHRFFSHQPDLNFENPKVVEAVYDVVRFWLDMGIDGFRAEHRSNLEDLAAQAVAEAKSGSEPVPMRPMNPFERKVVHDVAKREGLRSESEGEGKGRHVVIFPAS